VRILEGFYSVFDENGIVRLEGVYGRTPQQRSTLPRCATLEG
jgi:hypothetical protein